MLVFVPHLARRSSPVVDLFTAPCFLCWTTAAFLQTVDVVAYFFHLHHAFIVVVSVVCSGSTMSLLWPSPPLAGWATAALHLALRRQVTVIPDGWLSPVLSTQLAVLGRAGRSSFRFVLHGHAVFCCCSSDVVR